MIQKLLDIREQCHLKAKENIGNAQEKQKQHYDSKHNALKVSAFTIYTVHLIIVPSCTEHAVLSIGD